MAVAATTAPRAPAAMAPAAGLLLLLLVAATSAFLYSPPALPPPARALWQRLTSPPQSAPAAANLPPLSRLPAFLLDGGVGQVPPAAGAGGCKGKCGCGSSGWSDKKHQKQTHRQLLALAGGGDGEAATLQQEAPAAAEAQGAQQPRQRTREVHVVTVIRGDGARAPQLDATWQEIMTHMHRRVQYVDPAFHVHAVTEEDIVARGGPAAFEAVLPKGVKPDIVYFLGIQHPEVAPRVAPCLQGVPSVVALDSCPLLTRQTRLGPARPNGPLARVWRLLPVPTRRKKLLTLFDYVKGFWQRGHSDDIMYMVLVVINGLVTNVPAVSEILKPVTLGALKCMITKCGKQIVACQKDPVCKAALACLESCPPNDQVCRYRCIVQHETKAFEEFALCILQKHNCLGNHATIPTRPDPQPIASFRGQPLTHEMGEEISFGHLGEKPWSWKVIAGQNPAYDFFPSQHMTYYKKAKQLWYQPVFKVITHEGQEVWRRRLYRVRRAKAPGTFYYTVLDNGVTSAEYWRILDVDEDLRWILFYYTGAAAAAGQSYAGAILASATGDWPEGKEQYIGRIHAALDRAGIQPWELFMVRHGDNSDAPLAIDPLAEARFIYPNSTAAADAPHTPAEGFIAGGVPATA